MFKIGDKVGVELRDKCEYGTICDVDDAHSAVSIAIGTGRVVQVRACDCFYDEGYAKLKQGRFE